MAINLDAIRQKLNSLQTTTSKSNNLWKPEPGSTVVRIIPYQHNKENPFLELYFHYNFGGKNVLSPSSFGRPDPIIEFANKLKSTGNSDDWKAGKKLEPTMRCYVPILIRGKESEGVKFWGFGKSVYQELLGFIADPDYGDITDPTSGRDITVEFKTKDQTGKDFPETSIRVKPNQTAITDNKAVLEKLKSQPKITDVFKEPTYEEMTKMLQNWLDPEAGGGESTSADSEDAPAKAPKASNKSKIQESAPVANVDDVASAFDSLFNN
jgi:hypothetical protein